MRLDVGDVGLDNSRSARQGLVHPRNFAPHGCNLQEKHALRVQRAACQACSLGLIFLALSHDLQIENNNRICLENVKNS